MRSRLDDLPVFEIRHGNVLAADYNLVQIALKRLGSPLRLELPRLRTLDLILEKDTWVVVDRSLNDIPVLAWLDFEVNRRENLHEPVNCERRIYHTHARLILQKVFDAMRLILDERLAAVAPKYHTRVTPISRLS